MTVDRHTVRALVGNDLRTLLRNPRVLILSVLLPLLIWPVMLLLSGLTAERQEERRAEQVVRYAILGDEPDRVREWLATELPRDIGESEWSGEEVQLGASTDELIAAVDAEEIDLFLEGFTADRWRLRAQEAEAAAGEEIADSSAVEPEAAAPPTEEPPLPGLVIHYRSDQDASSNARSKLREHLAEVRRALRDQALERARFPVTADGVLPLVEIDTASADEATGLQLGRFLVALLVALMVSGGSVVAVDSLAGEKERGTLETLLTTAASRQEIVLAKSLSIVAVALGITVLQIANLVFWVRLDVLPMAPGLAIPISASTVALLLFLLLPIVALTSSLLLMVSGYAKSYKEAQQLFFPLLLACAVPAAVSVLPSVELRSVFVLVPIANLSLVVKEVLAGQLDVLFAGMAWLITAGVAFLLARMSVKALSSERLVTAADFDVADFKRGSKLYGRHVFRWFAALWAVFFVIQLNLETTIDVRWVLTLNMALFVFASFAFIRRYGLDVREVLSLRPVATQTWLGVLIGIPAGLVLAQGVLRLVSLALPVPDSWAEAFNEGLVPSDASFLVMVVMLSVLPGVCEEIAFRGALLHGVRQRFGLVPTTLLVGIIFGVFHVAIFRIPPTAFLGIVLTLVVLRTRSIFPAIVWHTGHNALALTSDRIWDAELQSWHFVIAAVGLALAFRLLRNAPQRPVVPNALPEAS